MTTDRPTPETDAVWADTSQNILEHAQRLERERDELLDRLTGLELRMPEELARLERERNEALAHVKRIQDKLHMAMWIIEKQEQREQQLMSDTHDINQHNVARTEQNPTNLCHTTKL